MTLEDGARPDPLVPLRNLVRLAGRHLLVRQKRG
jgi:hypothetical protein